MSHPVIAPVPLRDGRTAALAHIDEADAAAMLAFVEVVAAESDFLSFGPGEFDMTLEQEVAFLKTMADRAKGVLIKATVDGVMVANAVLRRSTRPRIRHVAELGLSVRRAFWGHGIGAAVCRAAFAAAREAGVTRVTLLVRADNERAIQLYERLGFAHEGRLVGAFKLADVAYDDLVMGLRL